MQEAILKGFCLGEVDAETLAADISGSVNHLNQIDSAIQIEEMRELFAIQRNHVMAVCEAALSSVLPPESLSAVAFALLSSDAFEWEDEVISDVLADWSCPEVNYPLTTKTLTMHRSWLTGEVQPAERPALRSGAGGGRLISRTTKARISRSSH